MDAVVAERWVVPNGAETATTAMSARAVNVRVALVEVVIIQLYRTRGPGMRAQNMF